MTRLSLFHDKYAPKSDLPTHHMLVRFVGFVEGKFLNQALNILQFGEFDGIFAVVLMSGRPRDN